MFYCIQDDKSKGRRTRKKREAKMGRFQGGKGINPGECGDRLLTDDDAELTLLLWNASEQI